MSTTTHATEAAASAASKAMYGGAATVTAGGVLAGDSLTAIVGLVLGGLGFLVNLFYKHREDRRRRQLLAAQIAAIERGQPAVPDAPPEADE